MSVPTLTLHPPSPEKAASLEYDYETIRNIDCCGTDFCVRVRDGMRHWNMTVQWWLAQYIYKSAPVRSYVLRSSVLNPMDSGQTFGNLGPAQLRRTLNELANPCFLNS